MKFKPRLGWQNLVSLSGSASKVMPGVMVSVLVALAAQFLSDHYSTPAMLLALLLGISLGFLGQDAKTAAGIAFTARSLLRLGVAFLGVRISMGLIAGLGFELVALVLCGVLATLGFGFAAGRVFGHKWRFAFLTAGSVAICGASAAMAISAILPKDERSEERLLFTVLGVTVLSTIAMILYPILARTLEFDTLQSGVFLGGTIHDVAQVVGAGFSMSEQTGDIATLVKLIRVAMLAPVVLVAAFAIRAATQNASDDTRPPLLPGFVLGFIALAVLNSAGLVPASVVSVLSAASRWLLLIAIAAVGMKTNLQQILSVGGAAIALIVSETVFLAIFLLAGLYFLT